MEELVVEVGGWLKVIEFVYDNNGNVLEVVEGFCSQNLFGYLGWVGEQWGSNLVDLLGWLFNFDSLFGGNVIVVGWQNLIWYVDEVCWVKMIGLDGFLVVVI